MFLYYNLSVNIFLILILRIMYALVLLLSLMKTYLMKVYLLIGSGLNLSFFFHNRNKVEGLKKKIDF